MIAGRKPGWSCFRTLAVLVACIAAVAHATSPPSRTLPALEVMHWLTSGRDAAALAVIRNQFIHQGGRWIETPMPGAGETGRAAAVNRIMGGRPPAVFQFSLGAELSELAAAGMVRTLPPAPDWEAAIPPAIAAISRYEGRTIAVPVTIRGENWMFYNKSLLQKMGIEVPKTWSQFIVSAQRLKPAGIIPLALGGQSWQERLLFNSVLLGVGGPTLYRRVYEQLDARAIDSDLMLKVFEVFGALRQYVDAGSPGRRWNQTTQLVIRGAAAFQIMGDWAKAEVSAAAVELGTSVDCTLAPAREPGYIMMVDGFAFASTGDPPLQAAQDLFARTVRDPAVQIELAQRLGSIPVRIDVPSSGFDACSAYAMKVVRDRTAQLMDPGLSLPGGLSGAIDDGISQFWNQRNLTAEQGRALLRQIIQAYR
jgi:glucose/mannose transport system substrate-binding protein